MIGCHTDTTRVTGRAAWSLQAQPLLLCCDCLFSLLDFLLLPVQDRLSPRLVVKNCGGEQKDCRQLNSRVQQREGGVVQDSRTMYCR